MITKRRPLFALLAVSAALIFTPSWVGSSQSIEEAALPVSPSSSDRLEWIQPTTVPEPDPKAVQDKGLPDDWPDDAQSTTGPIPPPSIEMGQSFASVDVGNILSAPAYTWYRGCGPTAAGMAIGYWDGNGFDDLVVGSAATQTSAVNAMISSSGNWDDYCLPLDYAPDPIQPDKSEPPVGDEHPDDSVADFMKTSQSFHRNYYGWSWYSHIDDALEEYVRHVAPHYYVNARNETWGAFTWETFKAEIDAGRPVMLIVDTNADGSTDHFITAIGYSAEGSPQQYAALNTWDTSVHWYNFARMSSGQPWGIYGATYFKISSTPLVANDDFDDAINITTLPFSDSRDILDASTSADDPDLPCGNGGTIKGAYSVWYRYTPPSNTIVNIDTFGSDYDTVLNVWSGARGSLTNEACNDDSGSLQSSAQVGLRGGRTYYIEVTSYGDWSYGTLNLNVSEEPFLCSTVSEIPSLECEGLVAFYNSTNGAEWGNWKTSIMPCTDWTGVVCEAGHVTELVLAMKGIEGTIPPEVGSLSHLTDLDLADNSMSGSLPSEIGTLSNLEILHIPGNQFTGNLPISLGGLGNLKLLYINSNHFDGPLPAELGTLTNLEVLYASANHIDGEIPAELGDLLSVDELYLDRNKFSGELPETIGNLSGLNTLRLQKNALEGDVPTSFTNLTNLSANGLDIGYNMLTASDSAVASYLDAADPDWADTQTIPPSGLTATITELGAVRLEVGPYAYTSDGVFQVYYGSVSGGPYTSYTDFPRTWDYIHIGPRLSEGPLYFIVRAHTPAHGDQRNELWSGFSNEAILPPYNDDFDDAYAIPGIDYFNLQDTTSATTASDDPIFSCGGSFNGTGVHSIWYRYTPNGGEFLSVDTFGSEYDTVLAVWTGTRGNLELVTCNDDTSDTQSQVNFFAEGGGTYFIEVIGDGSTASGIMNLHVAETAFTCDAVTEIPKSECEALESFYSGTDGDNWTDNSGWLENDLPCGWFGIICDSGNVHSLDLYNNNLTGLMPVELANLQFLVQLALQENNLTGNIPVELTNISTLQLLFLSRNDLSGSIPIEIGNLDTLVELTLGGNDLTGVIPAEIGNLNQLKMLWLSDNQLTGSIPTEFGTLSSLEEVRMHRNQLMGEIPASLGNLSQLEYLDLSGNQLSGLIPVELGNLTLHSLLLHDNRLEGAIPSNLVFASEMTHLTFASNAFEGEIPDAILSIANIYGAVDFGYNMLHSSNPDVTDFLAENDPDWDQTQTIPPSNIAALVDASDQIVVTWTPIPYTADFGVYEIGYSSSQGGPYTIHGYTFNKEFFTYNIDDLEPGHNYYVSVRSFTLNHAMNQNNLRSAFGKDVEILLPGAELSIPEEIPGLKNVSVSVPIEFKMHGRNISSTAFSLDFDEACLSFDPTDGDLDGVPEAINFNLPAGFTGLVTVDLSDTDGELDFIIADLVPPMSELSTGTIANVSFGVTCPSSTESYFAPVVFSNDPAPNFSSAGAELVLGITNDGSIEILPGTPGDVNGDDVVDIADLTALFEELFDGDGDNPLNCGNGEYAGDPVGCDPNHDGVVDAGDVSCTILIIFNGPGACDGGGSRARQGIVAGGVPSGVGLWSPGGLLAPASDKVLVPVYFKGESANASAIVFSFNYDETWLSFDPTDGNGDGIPDAIWLNISGAFTPFVSFDGLDSDGEIDFILADLSPPLSTFNDGPILYVELSTGSPGVQSEAFAGYSSDPDASFGDSGGHSVSGSVDHGSVLIEPGTIHKCYIPITLR